MVERISARGRNRALLARQLLLARSDIGVVAALEHLVAMQAQSPQARRASRSDLVDVDAVELLGERAGREGPVEHHLHRRPQHEVVT